MEAEVKTLLSNIMISTINDIIAGTIDLSDIFQGLSSAKRTEILDYIKKYNVKVSWADPRDPAQLPHISVLRNDESEAKLWLGDADQDEPDTDTGEGAEISSIPFNCDYALQIWTTNSEIREYLYRITKYALFIKRKYLTQNGLDLQKISGSDQEGIQSQYFPDYVYIARVGLGFMNILMVPEYYDNITEITLEAIDTYNTNYLLNDKFQIWGQGNGPFTTDSIETADYWYLQKDTGINVTVSRSDEQLMNNPYVIKCLIRDSKGGIYQNVKFDFLKDLQGKQVSIYTWVYCDVANMVKISINDGFTETKSSFHPGTGWIKMRVSQNIDQYCSNLKVKIYNEAYTSGVDLLFYASEIVLH